MKAQLLTAAAAVAVILGSTMGADAQRAARLPAQMPIENMRAANLTELVIVDGDAKVIGRLARPLAAGKKASVKLGRSTSCALNVRATFDDEGEVDETLDLCKEKRLRFVE
jgi:hypothetical protein